MNINDAKQIPLRVLVEYLGGRFARKGKADESWYYSPFRPDERTASFKIDDKKNRWHDFGHVSNSRGQKSGGDILDLWCDYYNQDRKTGVKAALEALEKFASIPLQNAEMHYNKKTPQQINSVKRDDELPQFKILKIHPKIFYSSLKEELQRRRISFELANAYLKQGYILDTKTNKTYNGFLFENDKGGYEISIPNPAKEKCIKRSTKPKTLSVVAGNKGATALDIFEGFWDFLSWLEMNKLKKTDHHVIVLNSLSFCNEAVEKIINQKHQLEDIFLFMDNDEAGMKATHLLAGELEPHINKIRSKEQHYSAYKDLSEYWTKTPLNAKKDEQAYFKVYNDNSLQRSSKSYKF